MVIFNRSCFTAALFLATVIAIPPSSAFAENATIAGKATGRFVALQPPAAGNGTYANFLWVLDSLNGKVVAYRISSINDAQGNHAAWVTERILTEEEYVQLLRSENK